jgi:hypothetical protein
VRTDGFITQNVGVPRSSVKVISIHSIARLSFSVAFIRLQGDMRSHSSIAVILLLCAALTACESASAQTQRSASSSSQSRFLGRSSSSFDQRSFANRMRQASIIQEQQREIQAERERLAAGRQARSVVVPSSSRSTTRGKQPYLNPREELARVGTSGRCGRESRSLLGIFGGAVTCGNDGIPTPGLINGDCPITACILRFGGNQTPVFGGPLDF